jgi:hypothetical protein
MKTIITMSKPYTNSSGREVLQYVNNTTAVLNLPFILTTNKELTLGMPYMLLEGNHTKAVRLVDLIVADGIVYLMVEDLSAIRSFIISWNLNYEGYYWLWSLTDLPTLLKQKY